MTPLPFVDWFWNLLGVECSRGEFGTWERLGDEVLDSVLLLEEAVLYRLGDTLLVYPLTGEWEGLWMGLGLLECGDESSSGEACSVRGR